MGFFDTIKNMINEYDEKNKVSQKCSSCGANIVGKASERAIKCEFCGNFSNNENYSPLINNPLKNFSLDRENSDSDFDDVDFDNNEDFDFNNFSDEENSPVFAWIEKSSLFFEGEIPGISFSRVSLCNSYKECVTKLKSKYYQEKNRAFYKKPIQNLREIKTKHPKAKIIILN